MCPCEVAQQRVVARLSLETSVSSSRNIVDWYTRGFLSRRTVAKSRGGKLRDLRRHQATSLNWWICAGAVGKCGTFLTSSSKVVDWSMTRPLWSSARPLGLHQATSLNWRTCAGAVGRYGTSGTSSSNSVAWWITRPLWRSASETSVTPSSNMVGLVVYARALSRYVQRR